MTLIKQHRSVLHVVCMPCGCHGTDLIPVYQVSINYMANWATLTIVHNCTFLYLKQLR